ncbi:Mitogen-activated protein kinase [Mycena venus]|uniref:Mitogen-activated protein kinase n=1 Tax=Mycena venus TaxID=2733690 RepID=A0A8H6XKT2_9AGAR|nr:Mitogen-activated protein kinase [Mycena venus]
MQNLAVAVIVPIGTRTTEAEVPPDPAMAQNSNTGRALSPGGSLFSALFRNSLKAGAVGRTMENAFSRLEAVVDEPVNRLAHKLGWGPNAVADKIIDSFGVGEQRVSSLIAVQMELKIQKEDKEPAPKIQVPLKLKNRCSKLVKYTLPKEAPDMRCQAFQRIVQLTTLFPGLRLLFLRSDYIQSCKQTQVSIADRISELWDRCAGLPDDEWKFWRSFAKLCLTDTPVSSLLEKFPIRCLKTEPSASISVIEELLRTHGSCDNAMDILAALCMRSLGEIVALDEFWVQLKTDKTMDFELAATETPHTAVNMLCLTMIRTLQDLEPAETGPSPFDYEGVDILADAILTRVSDRFEDLDPTDWRVELWYPNFCQVVQLLHQPWCAERLPHSYKRAISDSFKRRIALIPKNVQELHIEDLPDPDDVERDRQHEDLSNTTYSMLDVIGEGECGVVVSAVHNPTQRKVAIKRSTPFDSSKPPSINEFNEVYLVLELMETDLHRVIRTQELSDDHCQYFIYQTLRALKAVHSADVLHRDLNPSNLLVNANCDLKLCDFGLARSARPPPNFAEDNNLFMTEYVTTRWYRAPEVMLTFKEYTRAIDMWSVGCVLAELLSGKPLFPGRDYHHQLSIILDIVGTPSIDDFYAISSQRSREYIRALPFRKKRSFATLFPNANPHASSFLLFVIEASLCSGAEVRSPVPVYVEALLLAIPDYDHVLRLTNPTPQLLSFPRLTHTPQALDLMEKCLTFSPKRRIEVTEALAHPYMSPYHDPADEPTANPIDPSFFDLDPLGKEDLKVLIYEEVTQADNPSASFVSQSTGTT